MLSPLRWIVVSVVGALMGIGVPAGAEAGRERGTQPGLPLQSVLELEQTARLLAVLLDSGRAVVNDNQAVFADPTLKAGALSPEQFERQLADMFRGRAGADLHELDNAGIPDTAKRLLRQLVDTSKQVVALAQPEGQRPQADGRAFIPAVFGERVAARFAAEPE
jgi:hypothetical protein